MIRKLSNERRDRSFSKYLQYLLARGLISSAQRAPLFLVFNIGRMLGWLCWRMMPSRRAVVWANLEVVNASQGERSTLPINHQIRGVFAERKIYGGFRLARMSVEQQAQHIKIETRSFERFACGGERGYFSSRAHGSLGIPKRYGSHF